MIRELSEEAGNSGGWFLVKHTCTRLLGITLFALLFLSYSTFLVCASNTTATSKDGPQVSQDYNGIRIVVGDVEFYFNRTNGGEITEYFDLTVDPFRLNNLVNIGWKPYYNLLPLFTSLFYNPYTGSVFSTGGDPNAMVKLVANTSQYVILQTASKVMSRSGQVAKDAQGNAIYVTSTWILRGSGLVSVERTFLAKSNVTFPSLWRWYPFYLTRRSGFKYNGTYCMFNTTFAYSSVVNASSYRDIFGLYSVLPKDERCVFGVALPFSNTSIEGDRTHNILVAYKYDELANVDEWRTDNYYSQGNDVTESGAVYEFGEAVNVSTHTYHVLLGFTHQPIDETYLQSFATYYANDPTIALLMKCSISSNKDVYQIGDDYAFHGTGISYFNLTGVTARLTVRNSLNRVAYQRDYGPGSIMEDQTFNVTLLTGTIGPAPDNYTLLLDMFSPSGIKIASDDKTITILP